MTHIGNVMILASAGSGKTYALTNRFVKLLAYGAAPERIVALTFTRKAAGEFFDAILQKLARAARDPGYAQTLAEEIGYNGTDGTQDSRRSAAQISGKFLEMLRAMVDALHRLQLGTFDGFFARIARNFPLELGLTGGFQILQEHAARLERDRVLRRMFTRTGELDGAQRGFIEAFKRATFGVEEKRLGAQLDVFLDSHHEVFLRARDEDVWANIGRIWPDGSRWFEKICDPAGALQVLRTWLDAVSLAEKQRKRWLDFIEAWPEWAPGTVPSQPVAYMLKKALEGWDVLSSTEPVLKFDQNKQELGPAAAAALMGLTHHIVNRELARRLEMTKGIHAVLQSYETVYHDVVRRTGKLTFGDIERLLIPDEGAPVLSREVSRKDSSIGQLDLFEHRALPPSDRLSIDFRLDSQIDHWLLDEFQDTSFGQWSVLRNLIDEAVQDPTGARSFFFVGDVKQAIFAWRDGDPRLFREIFNHYNAVQAGTIAEEHLIKSWRSAPPIVTTVNQVFGDAAILRELFPGTASENWIREWRDHESARTELNGHAALLHGATREERFEIALSLLLEIAPLERGLTCALLVQTNSTAAELADYLREEGGIPAIAESDLHVCTDNPIGSALLSLVKAAGYPDDLLAWEHLQMTPLAGLMTELGVNSPERMTCVMLEQIHRYGFSQALRQWTTRLAAQLEPADSFSRLRINQFISAAALFDETGSRDIGEFIAFMERHVVRDMETAGVVRVMTIHKAKGLGFDLVILPDLEGTKLDCRREGLAVQKDLDRNVQWVLDLPGKLFHEHDAVLAAHVQEAEAAACYEALSLLYVAMTRAKQAMYVVTTPAGKSTSRNYPKLLGETLGESQAEIEIGARRFLGVAVAGDPTWFRNVTARSVETEIRAEVKPLPDAKPLRRLVSRTPSAGKMVELMGAQMFSTGAAVISEFGNTVHRLLAEVETLDAVGLHDLEQGWATRGIDRIAMEEVLTCLREPRLAKVWRTKDAVKNLATSIGAQAVSLDVWRERFFEIVLDDTWVTGAFDRAIVYRDHNGIAIAAEVFDFKTEQVPPAKLDAAVRRHAAQVRLYRRVAAVLAGIPMKAVKGHVLFTKARQLVSV